MGFERSGIVGQRRQGVLSHLVYLSSCGWKCRFHGRAGLPWPARAHSIPDPLLAVVGNGKRRFAGDFAPGLAVLPARLVFVFRRALLGSPVEPEDQLVSRARAGDAGAFALLCERRRGRIWRVVASVVRGAAAAETEDLAQEAIVRAFCALDTYRGDAPFEAWLCRIALNVAHDHQRSAWRRRVVTFWQNSSAAEDTAAAAALLPGEAATESLEGLAERREMQRRVRAAVAALPASQRVPIWLHYFEGFTLAEVARLESVSESTLRSRVQAGLRRLSRLLSDLVDNEHLAAPAALSAPDPKGCHT
jgi:RNA polymerase sigma-70 factor (ECF subfamily)